MAQEAAAARRKQATLSGSQKLGGVNGCSLECILKRPCGFLPFPQICCAYAALSLRRKSSQPRVAILCEEEEAARQKQACWPVSPGHWPISLEGLLAFVYL